MTIKERLKKILVDCGMADDQADEVLKEAIPRIESLTPRDYVIRWDEPSTAYPDSFYDIMWLTLSVEALKWIDKNCPLAWFRPMFELK